MNALLSRLIFGLVYLWYKSFRIRFVGVENIVATKNKSYLLGIFHQNLFAGIVAQTGLKYIVIVSKSKDASPVAYACASLGHLVVRGSSKRGGVDKGGKEAKEEMIEILKKGYPGAVTVDGPKGPAMIVKPGIVDMAKKAGSPIIPYICIAENCWSFNSWDKFRLPKPFSRVVAYYGSPIYVPKDAQDSDFEKYQLQLQNSLIQDEAKARAAFEQWENYPRKNFSLQ